MPRRPDKVCAGGKSPAGDHEGPAQRRRAERDREQCGGVHQAVERAGAQQFGGVQVGGEMRRRRPRRHRQETAEPRYSAPDSDQRSGRPHMTNCRLSCTLLN